MKLEDLSFEQAMAELDTIVLEMERGEIPLEASLKQFERGVTLARYTQKLLQDAEQKVSILTSTNDNSSPDTLTEFTE
ncbi:MAG: exodeoxyribonuclease VII small subunit [Alphaproteobacteria bacterium]|jgi:exodeoxyribonuclease VII small subunit